MNKKIYFLKTILFLTISLIYTLWGFSESNASPTISTIPDNEILERGGLTEVTVNVDLSGDPDLLGAYSIQLIWNPAVLQYVSVTGGISAGFTTLNKNDLNVSAGNLLLNHFNAAGTGGLVNIARVSFRASGSPGDTTTIGINVTSLTASKSFKDLKTGLHFQLGQVTVTVNNPPEITTTWLPDATQDQYYQATVDATDQNEWDTLTFTLVSGPDWLTINANTGELTGTAGNDDVDTEVNLVIKVHDTGGLTDYLSTTIAIINVNDPPHLITTQLPNATGGANYSFSIRVSDPDINDTLQFEKVNGPEWLSIDNSGNLTGHPMMVDAGSDIPIHITITDSGGLSVELSTTIDVITDNEPPQIQTPFIPDARGDEEYSVTIEVVDPDEGDTMTYDLLESPEWLTIDESGILSGTPGQGDAETGIPITIRVTDFGGLFDEVTFTLNVLRTDFGVLTGIVTEKNTGLAIENAMVNCGESFTTATNSNGEFEITDVLAGDYTITVSANNYQPYTGSSSIISGQTTEIHVELTRALGYGAIAGNVFDLTSGTSIINATIVVTPGEHTATSDSDGYYIIENLLAGTNYYRITATADNYIPQTQSSIYIDVSEEPLTVDFYLAVVYTPQVDDFTPEMDEYQVVGEEESLSVTTTISISSSPKITVNGTVNKITETSQGLYITAAELYFNNDPGCGNGYLMEAVDGNFDEIIEQVTSSVDVTNLLDGNHSVSIRALNSEAKWGYSNTGAFKKGFVIDPPIGVETFDVLHDNGHQIGLSWEASPSESEGLVELYRIFRSRSTTFHGPVSLFEIASFDSLLSKEQYYAVYIDSVSAGNPEYEYIDMAVPLNGVLYKYWIQAISLSGASKLAPSGIKVSVENKPTEYHLSYAYPNPFNQTTTIQYSVRTPSNVKLVIYNIQGQKIKTLINQFQPSGMHTIIWDSTDDKGNIVGSGIYIYRLSTPDFRIQKQLLLLH